LEVKKNDSLDGNDDSLNQLDGKELENTLANCPSDPSYVPDLYRMAIDIFPHLLDMHD